MFQAEFIDKLKTHILYSITFFLKRAVCEVMFRAGQATDDNMAYAHYMLDN
jgi:hypothetical protein